MPYDFLFTFKTIDQQTADLEKNDCSMEWPAHQDKCICNGYEIHPDKLFCKQTADLFYKFFYTQISHYNISFVFFIYNFMSAYYALVQ